jgi:sensor c-di-GMP phosphodiesterase-like protein
VPATLLLPQDLRQGGQPGQARMTMADGTPVGDSVATPDPAVPDARFLHTMPSKRYPLVISVSLPRTGSIANHDGLRRIALVMTGGIVLIMLLSALLLFRRGAIDPMADMARAIRDDEFLPYYQPVVDLQTGRLIGAEVLVRWRQPDGSFIEPNAFVLLLESSGLVLEFTRKLMRLVREDMGEAVGRRPNMSIAFNVAPRHFDNALILHDVGTIFDSSPIRLSQIVLELTERHEVTNFTNMRRTIAALQRVGCKVAIDDVSTGHSGLSYILKLGVDIIKIDKIFVEAIGSEGHAKPIIETLIDLAKNMRMEIVAEGVETFDQVTYLRDRGIGAAQGYVFAPPLPAATFLQLLEAMSPLADAVGRPPVKSAAAR